jgi:hypothetical protein
MPFTVMRPGGVKDVKYRPYLRLLRQRGIDLGKARRVAEPERAQRWLPVWDTRSEAQDFVDELVKRTTPGWQVAETSQPISTGPLGPILFQLVRSGVQITVAVDTLSRIVIQSAYPEALPVLSYAIVDEATWENFCRKGGDLPLLVQQLGPLLTGLTLEQMQTLGFAVADEHTEETVLVEAPAMQDQPSAA